MELLTKTIVEGGSYIYHGINVDMQEQYMYNENCLSWTLGKPKTCLNQTDITVPCTKFYVI
jgi:hypothetical protein